MEDKKKKYTQVIPVDDNTKEAFLLYCKDNFLGQSAAIKKWMTEEKYLNKDGTVNKEKKGK